MDRTKLKEEIVLEMQNLERLVPSGTYMDLNLNGKGLKTRHSHYVKFWIV